MINIVLFIPTALLRAISWVIDNTGNVVAADEIIASRAALRVAAKVKMAKNVLIGVAASLGAFWAPFNMTSIAKS